MGGDTHCIIPVTSDPPETSLTYVRSSLLFVCGTIVGIIIGLTIFQRDVIFKSSHSKNILHSSLRHYVIAHTLTNKEEQAARHDCEYHHGAFILINKQKQNNTFYDFLKTKDLHEDEINNQFMS